MALTRVWHAEQKYVVETREAEEHVTSARDEYWIDILDFYSHVHCTIMLI